MNRGSFVIACFVLSPLLYSFDGDPYRPWEVIGLAVVLSAAFFTREAYPISIVQPILVGCFAVLLVLQQLVVRGGDPIFGAKFAVVIVCQFLPFWVFRAAQPNIPNLNAKLVGSVYVLFYVATATIFVSYFFGIGEIYRGSNASVRAFGWLGDSFTPVLVLLILFFFLSKRYAYLAVALAALIVTGGKSAMIMLAVSPLLFVLISRMPRPAKVLALTVGGAVAWLVGTNLSLLVPTTEVDYSFNTRMLSISNGVDYFLSSPFVGIGINGSMRFVQDDANWLANVLGIVEYFPVYQIHNAFVRTAAETGLTGILLLLGICGTLIWGAWKCMVAGRYLPAGPERHLMVATGMWVILFIVCYQSTGWFEGGHPQLSWLLMFATIGEVVRERLTVAAARNAQLNRVDADIRSQEHTPRTPVDLNVPDATDTEVDRV